MTATKHTAVAIIIGLGLAHLSWLVPASPRAGVGERRQIERKAMAYTASDAFRAVYRDQRCHDRSGYRVYLIDNFEQRFHLVPEVLTTHGDMLVRMLQAGREDIDVRILNTALSKGLAQVIGDLADGVCVDAVVSAVPGSNYTYAQISSLLRDRGPVTAHNILYHRAVLRRLLRRIARHGFPSVEWLQNIDEDNRRDYTFFRVGRIAHRDERGQLAFAPPVTRQDAFARWLRMAARHPEARLAEEMVLTAGQYRQLKRRFSTTFHGEATRSYVWLNSPRHGRFYTFDPACWRRGSISGTSVIPPHKVKELLPPKMGIRSGGNTNPPPGAIGG